MIARRVWSRRSQSVSDRAKRTGNREPPNRLYLSNRTTRFLNWNSIFRSVAERERLQRTKLDATTFRYHRQLKLLVHRRMTRLFVVFELPANSAVQKMARLSRVLILVIPRSSCKVNYQTHVTINLQTSNFCLSILPPCFGRTKRIRNVSRRCLIQKFSRELTYAYVKPIRILAYFAFEFEMFLDIGGM